MAPSFTSTVRSREPCHHPERCRASIVSPYLTDGETEAQRKDATCPRSRHEIGQSPDLYHGSGWKSFSFSSTICSGPQGRCTCCYSTDKELCLLSSFPFSSMMCQLSVVESKSATFPSEKARHLLDDSVLESRSPRRGLALTSSSAVTNGLSLGKRLRPAHDSGRATVRCVLRVCLCHCAAPGGPPRPTGRAPSRGRQSQGGPLLPGLQGFPRCPERGRQGEGAAGRTPETRCHWLAAAKAWLLPQCAEPRRGSCLGTAAGRATGSLLCTCLHTEKPELGRMKN